MRMILSYCIQIPACPQLVTSWSPPDKTELILFTTKTKILTFNLPRLNGTELKLSSKAKYLGLILVTKFIKKLIIESQKSNYYFLHMQQDVSKEVGA